MCEPIEQPSEIETLNDKISDLQAKLEFVLNHYNVRIISKRVPCKKEIKVRIAGESYIMKASGTERRLYLRTKK